MCNLQCKIGKGPAPKWGRDRGATLPSCPFFQDMMQFVRCQESLWSSIRFRDSNRVREDPDVVDNCKGHNFMTLQKDQIPVSMESIVPFVQEVQKFDIKRNSPMDYFMKELEEGNANDVISSLCLKKSILGEMEPNFELKQICLEHFF